MADQVRAGRPEKCSLVDINSAGVATHLADRALARSTRDAYDRAARAFDEWLGGGRETDAAVAAYLGAQFDRGHASASAGTAVAALKDRAGREGTPSPAGRGAVLYAGPEAARLARQWLKTRGTVDGRCWVQ